MSGGKLSGGKLSGGHLSRYPFIPYLYDSIVLVSVSSSLQQPHTPSHQTSPTSPSLQPNPLSLFTHPHPRRLVCTEPGTIPLRDNPHVDLGPGSLLYILRSHMGFQVELCGTRISVYNGIYDAYSSINSKAVQFKKSSFSGSKAFIRGSICFSLNLSSSSSSNPFNMHIKRAECDDKILKIGSRTVATNSSW